MLVSTFFFFFSLPVIPNSFEIMSRIIQKVEISNPTGAYKIFQTFFTWVKDTSFALNYNIILRK